ncbi:hypothetical protein FSP39_020676 [Pinctada imbricata]|uniref:Apple domain-containing protein n=1 Tax=Pinctada imbricata TaxID=66713 RepID=A0AA89CBC4_PINIB|nr:hypothetical protein FSP39_020676 [Pinctada imbricata]
MCIRECVKRNCKSVNFNKEKLQCDLMSTNDGCLQDRDVFQEHPDYIFVNFSDSENIEKVSPRPNLNIIKNTVLTQHQIAILFCP